MNVTYQTSGVQASAATVAVVRHDGAANYGRTLRVWGIPLGFFSVRSKRLQSIGSRFFMRYVLWPSAASGKRTAAVRVLGEVCVQPTTRKTRQRGEVRW